MCTDMYRVAVMKISYASIVYIYMYILYLYIYMYISCFLSLISKTRVIPWKNATRCSIIFFLFFLLLFSLIIPLYPYLSQKRARATSPHCVLYDCVTFTIATREKSKAPDLYLMRKVRYFQRTFFFFFFFYNVKQGCFISSRLSLHSPSIKVTLIKTRITIWCLNAVKIPSKPRTFSPRDLPPSVSFPVFFPPSFVFFVFFCFVFFLCSSQRRVAKHLRDRGNEAKINLEKHTWENVGLNQYTVPAVIACPNESRRLSLSRNKLPGPNKIHFVNFILSKFYLIVFKKRKTLKTKFNRIFLFQCIS